MTVIMVLLVVYCRIANGNGNVNGAGGSSIINTCGDVNDLWKDKPSLGQDLSENIYILGVFISVSECRNGPGSISGCFDLWMIRGPIEALLRGLSTLVCEIPTPSSQQLNFNSLSLLPLLRAILSRKLFVFGAQPEP